MKNLQEKLASLKIEQLEERKEFTFYCWNPCPPPPCNPGGGTGGGGGGTGGN